VSETANGELLHAIQTAVDSAVGAALEQERKTVTAATTTAFLTASADEDERDELARRLKRVKVVAGVMVSLVTALASVGAWVYARGEEAKADEQHELEQDRVLGSTKVALDSHVVESKADAEESEVRMRNIGALQIEQGNDQRKILLESAPRAVRARNKDKPPELLEAEGRVLRD
jgi:hypothetical protein